MRQFLLLSLLLLTWQSALGQTIDPDDAAGAKKLLLGHRQEIARNQEVSPPAKAYQLIKLGLWKEAKAILDEIPKRDYKTQLVRSL